MSENTEEKRKKIESFSSRNNNKIVYLMLVEDLGCKPKTRAFVGDHLSSDTSSVLLRGYEINWSDRDSINSFESAIEKANEYNNEDPDRMIEVTYPWLRIIRVQNITYKRK